MIGPLKLFILNMKGRIAAHRGHVIGYQKIRPSSKKNLRSGRPEADESAARLVYTNSYAQGPFP